MAPIVRFAPSPTGRLHIGNVRTAVLNWLFARKHGGKLLLRLDDTDRQRSTQEFASAIETDLMWLGLTWDDQFRQSDRVARYAEVAEALKAKGRLYPCYETEEELERRRARQRARGLPPVYDRSALRLSAEERARFEAQGRKPHWRFLLANSEPHKPADIVPTLVTWKDLVRGDCAVDIASLSDPVIVRADGTCLYTFTSVVDDIDRGVTHIIRGEDHVTNTAVQIQLFSALEAPSLPAFAHFSLLVDKDGKGLSKRLGSLSVDGLREAGLEPMAVNCHAALIGTSEAVAPYVTLEELTAHFDIARLSRSPSRFDVAELEALNARLLHVTPYDAVASKLRDLGVGGGAPFWDTVRGNLGRMEQAQGWWTIVSADIDPVIENAAFCQAAAAVLPDEPWNADTWKQWTDAVKGATGIKGRELFHPLRLALTGRDNGPELKALLPLIGRQRALRRLRGT
jgi:glutamyl-tRNA synthetase